jgi:hypothetical protein
MRAKALAALATLSARMSTPLSGLVLLVAACASASLVFACATPFAAFAVVAAAIMPLPSALLAIAAVWLANQAIGYGLLGYPWTLDSAAWGLALGAAAVLATLVAAALFQRLAGLGRLAVYPLALLASFAAYEVFLLAMTPLLGGAAAFAPDIVGRIAFLNAVWLAGLAGVYEVGRLLESSARRTA